MHGDQTMGQFTGHIQSLKIMVNYKTLVRFLTGGVLFTKGWEKFWYVGSVVAYERWSHKEVQA